MSIKVLIVDDEKEFAFTLSERLQLRDYDANAVYCAEDAFAVVASNPPDVVLLDLRMPGMDGMEILQVIKEFAPTIEVIILTGNDLSQNKEKNQENGAFDFMLKPVSIDGIIKKIESAVQARNKKLAKSSAGAQND